jgi:hypothetical protein
LLAVRGKNTLVFDDVDQDSRDMFIRSGEMDSHAYFGSQTELAAESFPVLAREEEVVGRAPPTQDLTFIDLSSP